MKRCIIFLIISFLLSPTMAFAETEKYFAANIGYDITEKQGIFGVERLIYSDNYCYSFPVIDMMVGERDKIPDEYPIVSGGIGVSLNLLSPVEQADGCGIAFCGSAKGMYLLSGQRENNFIISLNFGLKFIFDRE